MTEGMAPVYDTVDWETVQSICPWCRSRVTNAGALSPPPSPAANGKMRRLSREARRSSPQGDKVAAETQKRQCEMRAELIESGAFEKRSALILPDRMN